MPTSRGFGGAGRTAPPATAGASPSLALLPLRSEHSLPGGACGAAYLSPLFGVLVCVAGVAVDDRLEHSFGRATEDDGRCGILDRMVRASRERHDRQDGALGGRQGTHLILNPPRPGSIEGRRAHGIG